MKCPHCSKEINDSLVAAHLSKKGKEVQKKKYADYNEEMRRRVNVRWNKK